jgi:hypothetical protein
MASKQRGMTLIGLIFTLLLVGFVALIVLKITPVYIDYFSVKKAVATSSQSGPEPGSIRAAFDRAAVIDRIDVIKGRDLTITGGQVSFAYDEVVHLFGNISLLIEFEGTSNVGSR